MMKRRRPAGLRSVGVFALLQSQRFEKFLPLPKLIPAGAEYPYRVFPGAFVPGRAKQTFAPDKGKQTGPIPKGRIFFGHHELPPGRKEQMPQRFQLKQGQRRFGTAQSGLQRVEIVVFVVKTEYAV